MDPLVSVVIPNFNNGLYLEECISSVLSQTYTNFEIIVIDDGSSDNSLEILRKFKKKIRIIEQQHQGAASARNNGIRRASGEFIAFLDSDDVWRSEKLELQVKKMQNPKYGLVYCGIQEFNSSGNQDSIYQARFEGDCYPVIKRYPHSAIIVGGCSTALVRTSVLISASIIFDENMKGVGEDLDFFRKVCRVTSVGKLPEILVGYRRHASNSTFTSKRNYFKGIRIAVINLIQEDSSIGRLEGRVIWTTFLFAYLKTFAKALDFAGFCRVVMQIFGRIPKKT